MRCISSDIFSSSQTERWDSVMASCPGGVTDTSIVIAGVCKGLVTGNPHNCSLLKQRPDLNYQRGEHGCEDNANRRWPSSSPKSWQRRTSRIGVLNELRRAHWVHSRAWPCVKIDRNKLIEIHRLSYPIFRDAKSQRARGNNAKRYIITAALLNFCGQRGTGVEFVSERGKGRGLEKLS